INDLQVLQVLLREKTVPLLILPGLQDLELFFPEPDQGSVDIEHLRDLSDAVIEFIYFTLFVGHSAGLLSQMIGSPSMRSPASAGTPSAKDRCSRKRPGSPVSRSYALRSVRAGRWRSPCFPPGR